MAAGSSIVAWGWQPAPSPALGHIDLLPPCRLRYRVQNKECLGDGSQAAVLADLLAFLQVRQAMTVLGGKSCV